MTVDVTKERERLSQQRFLDWVRRDFSPGEMIPVWWDVSKPETEVGLSCALIPNARVEASLEERTWDLMDRGGRPGMCKSRGENGGEVIEYDRLGFNGIAEPFVFHRTFSGLRPEYVEVSEEFRLFHNLYHDRTIDKYLKLDDAGNEMEVIVIEPDRVQVRLLEIRQYLAARDLHFALLFDNREHSRLSLEELGLKEDETDQCDGLLSWGIGYGDLGVGGLLTFSRLLGKRLFPPLPKERCGIWPFDSDADEVVQFIIGMDEAGAYRLDVAARYGGSAHYLTPVWFRKTVLDKYHAQPSKYSVGDGYVRCGALWDMTLDNHHEDYVVAWLGDLNRDLPYQEQLHWRGHNVPRCGPMSNIFFGRQLECRPLDSDQPEHVFQWRYADLAGTCQKQLGWQLILPLAAKDKHHLRGVRVPATDEQKDFDDLILGLAKILIDSLNEAKLGQLIAPDAAKGLRGSIAKLEAALMACGVTDDGEHIKFMRNLQNLRSTGSAHRKGSDYQTIAAQFGVESQNLRSVFRGILQQAIALLDYLISVVESGKLAIGPNTPSSQSSGATS